MRRGLMGWNAEELPKAALEARIARLRAALARNRLDAALFYTNLVQPSAVTWLTGFTPYWSDGMLLLPPQGAPVFATALSKRVANWIRTTDDLSEIVNTPKPGAAVGQRLAEAGCRRVGVLEYDALPAGLYDEIVGAAPGVELVEMDGVFADARRTIDDAERGLIGRADALARTALDLIDATASVDAGAVAGIVEKHARLGGAEEAYIAVAPDLDAERRLIRVAGTRPLAGRFAVRASVAYKGAWVRRIRSFAADPATSQAYAAADGWLAAVVESVASGQPLAAQLEQHLRQLPGATLRSWMVESCIGSYPLKTVAATGDHGWSPVAGSFLVLTVELALDGAPWLGAAPVLVAPA
jgi:Creatinase/Prolidase N-terminal domain